MRAFLAGLIVALAAAEWAHAGQGTVDGPTATVGRSAAKAPSHSQGCTTCALRHQSKVRRHKELQAAKEARGDCQIKGDVTLEGQRLYHRPGDRRYEWVWINEAKGERWFCSIDEAEAAGWRAAGEE